MMEVGLSPCWLGWVTLCPNRKPGCQIKSKSSCHAGLPIKWIWWTKDNFMNQNVFTNLKHLSFRALWQTPLCSVDQRASLCSQLLIVNEDWCLGGWPCLRFLSGMDAYWSLHFYALLGTQSPLFLMVFWSTLRTALVMIDGIDSDKNKPERMNVIEKERGWNSRNLDENTMKCFSIVSLVAYY